jgi:hypothetical protein
MWMLALYVVDAFLAARAAEQRQTDVVPAGSGVSTGSSALHGKPTQRSVRDPDLAAATRSLCAQSLVWVETVTR